MRNAWLDEAQAGIKIAGRNINKLRYADDTTLMAESEEELKRLLTKVKEESEKIGLELNIQKTKIMASSPITSWQIDGKQWKQWQALFSWAPKSLQMVTAAMKLRTLAPLKKSYVRQPKRHRCKEQSFGLWEKARVGWFERIELKHVYYHMWNRSPFQVWWMRQGAQGWCTEMTLKDGMGREVEGGFRMGNTCTPMADSCQCMAKTTTIL